MRRALVIGLLSGVIVACGGGGSPGRATTPPAAQAPGIAGLERAVSAARGVVAESQQDAQRASATNAGQ